LRVWRFGDPVTPLRELLDRGGILAVPTESSYGLAADPRSERGVRAIDQVKGRTTTKALPVVAGDIDQLAQLGIDPDSPAVAPFAACWPAALSVIADTAQPLPAGRGEARLAVRIPAHPPLRELLRAIGRPLTATSANLEGQPPIVDSRQLAPLLAGADGVIVDGGRLAGGLPSTLVELRGATLRVLRPGRFPVDELRRLFSTATVEILVENPS
jgi:L-threonylcarbamoyladenylate synthase